MACAFDFQPMRIVADDDCRQYGCEPGTVIVMFYCTPLVTVDQRGMVCLRNGGFFNQRNLLAMNIALLPIQFHIECAGYRHWRLVDTRTQTVMDFAEGMVLCPLTVFDLVRGNAIKVALLGLGVRTKGAVPPQARRPAKSRVRMPARLACSSVNDSGTSLAKKRLPVFERIAPSGVLVVQ